jgi:tetratricopeptide (TPR) repeat protein
MTKWLSPLCRGGMLLGLLLLVSCGGGPRETPPGADTSTGAGRAVTSLLAKADQQMVQGSWEHAAALLERALRIEPRNARLWQRLAEVRLSQGRYAQAESLARKSNALAADDATLQARNAQIIQQARLAQGL